MFWWRNTFEVTIIVYSYSLFKLVVFGFPGFILLICSLQTVYSLGDLGIWTDSWALCKWDYGHCSSHWGPLVLSFLGLGPNSIYLFLLFLHFKLFLIWIKTVKLESGIQFSHWEIIWRKGVISLRIHVASFFSIAF